MQVLILLLLCPILTRRCSAGSIPDLKVECPCPISVVERSLRQHLDASLPQLAAPISSKPISMAQNFPFDILSEIFSYYDRDSDGFYIPPNQVGWFFRKGLTGRICNGPWKLARVCQHWRGVALASPFLWSTVLIDALSPSLARKFNYTRICSCEHGKFLIKEGLKRSGSAPLYLKWSLCIGRRFKPIQALFLPAASRWKELHIVQNHDGFGYFLPKITLPMLEDLKIYRAEVASGSLEDRNIDTPNLKRLALHGFDAPFRCHFPWKQIRSLYVYPMGKEVDSVLILSDALLMCPELQSLTSDWYWDDEVGSLPNITHSSLKSLNICNPRWLESATLPELQSLAIDIFVSDEDNDLAFKFDSIISLIFRSGCILQKLELRIEYGGENFSLSKWPDCLSLLNNLSALTIAPRSQTDLELVDVAALLHHLVRKSGSPSSSLLPKLSELRLVIAPQAGKRRFLSDLTNACNGILFDVVSSRVLPVLSSPPLVELKMFSLTVRRTTPTLPLPLPTTTQPLGHEMKQHFKKWEQLRDTGLDLCLIF